MSIMTTSTWLPHGRPFTVADLDALPDDGNRYELIDGALVVSPAPVPRHQRLVTRLWAVLDGVCPDDLEVFVAPLDVRLADDTSVQPDVLVARRSDLTEANLPVAPMLAVAILSPSTRTIDLHSKKERLRRAGCPAYWVIDPLDGHLTAWELDAAGDYLQIADLAATDTWHAGLPFPVEITTGALLR